MTETQEISRGQEAQRLMEHPLMVEAFSVIERTLLDNLKQVPVTDAALEREYVRTLQLLGKLRGHFVEAMETGKLARATKEQRESMGQKLRRVVGM